VKILLLSAYAAQSHVQWQRGLRAMLPEFEWQVLELPPRHFSWRVRGNALYWALQERELLNGGYDLVLATSMVDLATLRGLVPTLCTTPAILYFHENQFDYPRQQRQHSLLEAQMVSLYSALAADSLLFNSNYNRESFLDGCEKLLGRLPDKVPPGVVALLREKSAILPVAIDRDLLAKASPAWPGTASGAPGKPLRIVWCGRFEYDKGAQGLLPVLQQLERQQCEYELALVGQQFRNLPPVFADIQREFPHRLVHCGYLEEAGDYHALLRGADVVLSTSLHEFQGLAVLEAVAAGCIPAVPDRLAYRDMYPDEYRYPSLPGNPLSEARGAAQLLLRLADSVRNGTVRPPDISAFDRRNLGLRYLEVITGLARASA
jgi:glycosyltransferase involved in cell wall biosynthesis